MGHCGKRGKINARGDVCRVAFGGWGGGHRRIRAVTSRYGETLETVSAFLNKVDASRLSFDDVRGSMAYLETISKGDFAGKCPINIALLDGAGKKAGKAVYDLLDLGFTENKHVTSYTIGIDTPEIVRLKAREAAQYPVLEAESGHGRG